METVYYIAHNSYIDVTVIFYDLHMVVMSCALLKYVVVVIVLVQRKPR